MAEQKKQRWTVDTVKDGVEYGLVPLAIVKDYDRLRDMFAAATEVQGDDEVLKYVTSGNSIPVTRCTVSADLIRQLVDQRRALSPASSAVTAGNAVTAVGAMPTRHPVNNWSGAWEQYADEWRRVANEENRAKAQALFANDALQSRLLTAEAEGRRKALLQAAIEVESVKAVDVAAFAKGSDMGSRAHNSAALMQRLCAGRLRELAALAPPAGGKGEA